MRLQAPCDRLLERFRSLSHSSFFPLSPSLIQSCSVVPLVLAVFTALLKYLVILFYFFKSQRSGAFLQTTGVLGLNCPIKP